MDQEKFDQHLMDYLFEELDEVTSAAMKRKIESDADCRELVAGLRATIEVAKLPIEEPSVDLEDNILAAATIAADGEPWHRKLLRSLSWAGSHAMRPQLAMAAILMLVLGSSILLLRARPGSVAVTPHKDPTDAAAVATAPADEPQASEPEALAQAEADATPSAAARAAPPMPSGGSDKVPDAEAVASLEEQYQRGVANYQAGRHLEAQKDFATVSASQSPKAASAAMFEARSVRAHSGPKAAINYYQRVISNFGGSPIASDAKYELADCYLVLGEVSKAKELFLALAQNPAYRERAQSKANEAELAREGQVATSGGDAVASKRRAAAAAPAPKAKPAAPSAQPNEDGKPGGSGGKAKAAPDDAYKDAL